MNNLKKLFNKKLVIIVILILSILLYIYLNNIETFQNDRTHSINFQTLNNGQNVLNNGPNVGLNNPTDEFGQLIDTRNQPSNAKSHKKSHSIINKKIEKLNNKINNIEIILMENRAFLTNELDKIIKNNSYYMRGFSDVSSKHKKTLRPPSTPNIESFYTNNGDNISIYPKSIDELINKSLGSVDKLINQFFKDAIILYINSLNDFRNDFCEKPLNTIGEEESYSAKELCTISGFPEDHICYAFD